MPDSVLPLQTISEEEKELEEFRGKFNSHPKLSKWFDLYFDKSNPQTYLKRTEAAIIAYELNPNDPKARKYAWELGAKNARKCKFWIQRYYETVGMTPENVLNLIAHKATEGNNAKMIMLLAELVGVYEPKPSVAIQNNTQITNITDQHTAEEIEQAKNDFREFIYNKYKNSTVMDGTNIEV